MFWKILGNTWKYSRLHHSDWVSCHCFVFLVNKVTQQISIEAAWGLECHNIIVNSQLQFWHLEVNRTCCHLSANNLRQCTKYAPNRICLCCKWWHSVFTQTAYPISDSLLLLLKSPSGSQVKNHRSPDTCKNILRPRDACVWRGFACQPRSVRSHCGCKENDRCNEEFFMLTSKFIVRV